MSAALDGSIRNISDNVLDVRIGAVIDVLGGSDMAIKAIHEMKRPNLEGTLRLWMVSRSA
jgi:hypothetical protein